MLPHNLLTYADGSGKPGHWFIQSRLDVKIHASTGYSVREQGYVERVPRVNDQPFWRHEHRLTDAGRAALARTGGRNG